MVTYKYHTYRLCPFSQEYKALYYDNGFDGNSTYPDLPVSSSRITAHPTTSGLMITWSRGSVWGFACEDPNCWHYLNIGYWHFES